MYVQASINKFHDQKFNVHHFKDKFLSVVNNYYHVYMYDVIHSLNYMFIVLLQRTIIMVINRYSRYYDNNNNINYGNAATYNN